MIAADAATPRQTRFDATSTPVAVSAVPPTGPSRFEVDLDPSWSSLVGIHGGYMAAISLRAAEQVADGRTARTLTASFLRRGRPGPAEVTVETVRNGRSVSTFAVTLSQDDQPLVTSRVTAVVDLAGERWETPDPLVLPPVEVCEPIAPPEGVRHFEQATARLDPGYTPFSHGDLARVGGYVRPLEPRPIDPAWLVMILDWFPPSPFTASIRRPGASASTSPCTCTGRSPLWPPTSG